MLAGLLLSSCIPSVDNGPYGGYAAPAPAPVPTPAPTDEEPARQPVIAPSRPPYGVSARPSRPARVPRPPTSAQPRPDYDAAVAAPRRDISMPRTARPIWETRPVEPDAQIIAERVYDVAAGDTLQRLADRTGAGIEAIARANDLPPPYAIRAGQKLTIPGGRYHLVRQGESGIAIARAYGVPWSRIITANQLTEPYMLRAGQRVLIPGDPARPPSRAERAAAFTLAIDDILTGGEPVASPRQAPARPVDSPRRVLPPTAVVAAPARLQGGFVWPVNGTVVRRFGPGKTGERNDGIKIAVPLATPIHATADGVVAYVGDGIAALGGLIIIRHGNGWTSVYGHAAKLLVQRGQSVKRGQTIALSGDTGFADRPELHFELRKGRTPVDPQSQLPRG